MIANGLIVFDVETAGNSRATIYYDGKFIEAPGNYKDEAKIKAYIEEKRHEMRSRAGLTPWTGRVTCVVLCDGEAIVKFFGEDERKILIELGGYLQTKLGCQLVGKNSKTFDVPFLVGRYIAHGLGVPSLLRVTDKPRDIDECFGYSSQSIRGSLSDYAFMMGVDGKLSHGSKAQDMFNETAFDPAKWDELVQYCERDVAITHAFLTRYMKPFEVDTTPLTDVEVPFGA